MRVRDRSMLDLLLLGAVRDEPGDGAAVMHAVNDRAGRQVISTGSLYPALHRLERNRLVRRSGRRVYQLTDSGERVLRSRVREFAAQARLVRAVLGDDVPVMDGAAGATGRAGRARGSGRRGSGRTAR
ncbi:helix-turn-helix transcriptional regulator [Pseudonocardia nematodicida]|uniref:Helix-turn-helix transcriptional regulator n=1 Tax=Pseudonocardia nematodicida TaxID=1206997 RepID=A0ABV1KHW2_9PSEU